MNFKLTHYRALGQSRSIVSFDAGAPRDRRDRCRGMLQPALVDARQSWGIL